LFHENAGSGARPVRKNPSISLICAKCTAGGAWPFSSGPKPCDGADWQTCTVPATTPSMADLPSGAMECLGANPSCWRKPPAIVAISGE
jgi:hypothetical protein